MENQNEILAHQGIWMDEKTRLESKVRQLELLFEELKKKNQDQKAESDERFQDLQRKSQLTIDQIQSDLNKTRVETDKTLAALKHENALKIAEYESQLIIANDNRTSSIIRVSIARNIVLFQLLVRNGK